MEQVLYVTKSDGRREPLDVSKISKSLEWASEGKYTHLISDIMLGSKLHFFDGISTEYILDITIKTARDLADVRRIGMDVIAKNLMLQKLYKQVNKGVAPKPLLEVLKNGIELGIYRSELLTAFTPTDIEKFDAYIDYGRDFNFTSAGLEALIAKYMKHHKKVPIELPQHMFMLIAMDTFHDYKRPDAHKFILDMYDMLSQFKITLPTPEMNALRTPSTDYASCVLLKTGDSLDSWNEASKALVLHTAASAGVGNDISSISSIADPVKNGAIFHGGKVPVLKSIDADIQKAVQNGRRGSATAFINFFDPEIIQILSLKSPRTEVAKRINDLSYGIKLRDLVYERAKAKQAISLFSNRKAPELYEVFHSGTRAEFKEAYEKAEAEFKFTEQVDARYFLDVLETEMFENSSYYVMNVDEVNLNSPYVETIYQSNICMEEVSPTKDISSTRPNDPDIAICVLGNVNQSKVSLAELPKVTDILVRAQTHIMLRQKHPMPQADAYVAQYRSIGIGFSNHAHWVAMNDARYGDEAILAKHDGWMEAFQYGLINASANLALEIGPAPRFFTHSTYAKGIMPIDRYKRTVDELVPATTRLDWETLRNKVMTTGMANVALSMVPPAESSSVPSNQTNALEPIKDLITFKESKTGNIKQFAPDALKLAAKYDFAYATKDMTKRYLKHIAVTQKWLDKSISTNRFYNPELYPNSKVPLAAMREDLYFAKYYGVKTLYYTNTYVADVEEAPSGCEGGACSV